MMAEGGSFTKTTKSMSLDCSICLERFRNPKTLPCLHSYCEECLLNYTTKGAKSIKCPQCKEKTPVPEGDARKFKSNFHLKELVEEAKLTEEINYPSLKLVCNCCGGGLEAVSRCVECNQYLCSGCLEAHNRFPSLRGHVVASLEEIRDGKVRPRSNQKRQLMCTKHPSNKAEIYCTTCEKPICHICATLKHKSPDHDCIETSEATESRKEKIVKALRKLDRKVEREFGEITEKVEGVRQHASDLKESINASCRTTVLKLEIDRDNLVTEVNGLLHSDFNQLQPCLTATEDRVRQIQCVRDAMTLEDASDGHFLSLYNTVKMNIEKLRLKKSAYSKIRTQVDKWEWMGASNRVLGELTTRQLLPPSQSNLKLQVLKVYKPKDKSKHEFYGIDCCEYTMAVTDRQSNQVVLLYSQNLTLIRVVDGIDKVKLKSPIDVAFYNPGGYNMIVIDHSNRATMLTNNATAYVNHHHIVACKPDQCDIKWNRDVFSKEVTALSVVADNDDMIIVGATSGQGYRWLIRYQADGKSSNDTMRIQQTPNFLTLARNNQRLFVSDTLTGTVTCLGRRGTMEFQLETKRAGQRSPTGVCCDADDNVYVASITTSLDDAISSSIHKYTSSGCYIGCLGDFDHAINGMVFTKAGKLAAACGDSVKLMDVVEVV